MAKAFIVAGTTTALTFQLLEAGTPINLTGITVSLILTDKDGTAVTTTGKTAVTVPSTGTVTFSPSATDLTEAKSPYRARWKLVDGAAKVSYVPTGYRDQWDVVAE